MIMTKNVTPYQGYGAASVTVSGGVSNYNVKQNSNLFVKVSVPTEIRLHNGSTPLLIKFNAPTHDSMPLAANQEFIMTGLIVSNVYVSNTASGVATLDLFTLGSM